MATTSGLTFAHAADRFRTYLEVECDASPHTIRNYLSDLEQFGTFAKTVRPSEAPLAPEHFDADFLF